MGYYLTVLCQFLETLIVSIGSHLSFSSAGIFFLGFPVTFSFSAYTVAILQTTTNLNLSIIILFSLLLTFLMALGLALAYTKLSNDSYAVLTLSSLMAFDAIVKSWDTLTGGVLGIYGIMRPDFFQTLPSLAAGMGLLTFLLLCFEWILLKTPFGRSFRSLKESPLLLNATGTSAKSTGAIIIIISSIFAAIAGIFTLWRIQIIDPSFGGMALLLPVLTIAILAHKPRVSWIILSTLFVILLPELLKMDIFTLSSSHIGHIRLLLYSLLIIFFIKTLTAKTMQQQRIL